MLTLKEGCKAEKRVTTIVRLQVITTLHTVKVDLKLGFQRRESMYSYLHRVKVKLRCQSCEVVIKSQNSKVNRSHCSTTKPKAKILSCETTKST